MGVICGPSRTPGFSCHTVLEYHRRDWIRPFLAAEVNGQLLAIGSKMEWFSSLGRGTPLCLGGVLPRMISTEEPLLGRPPDTPNGSAEPESAVPVLSSGEKCGSLFLGHGSKTLLQNCFLISSST